MKPKQIFAIAFLFMASAALAGAQTLLTLCSFAGTNGAAPYGNLLQGNDGSFFGTTFRGGITNSPGALNNYGSGTVFNVTTNGTLTVLAFFNNTNGAAPVTGLTLGTDGSFYGTTSGGGSNDYGTIFRLTTNGTLTMLVAFANTNGAKPFGGLTLGSDGNLYGTTDRKS